jgi:hypothetical protein
MKEADKPFYFKTQLSLVMTTGLKAKNLAELRAHLATVPESSVFYHTHHFLQQHQFLTPEPPNDFAYWVTNVLQEDKIGEKLAAIDTVRFDSLGELRNAILQALDQHLARGVSMRECPEGEEFHFMRSILFDLPTPHSARNLSEFRECLKKVSIHSLYFHVFTGRLRQPVGVNDFSDWLTHEIGEEDLARQIDKLDPYTQTMEGLRQRLIHLIDRRLAKENKEHAHVVR